MAHSFQAPKGTRDFYPDAMAVRRHIEQAWRTAATSHGFDEIEGPTYEHLELYTVKSGDTLGGIAKAHYGDAMKYMKIFEANTPMLEDPNKIYPGQVLRIPTGD